MTTTRIAAWRLEFRGLAIGAVCMLAAARGPGLRHAATMPWHALWLCAMTLMVVGSSDPVRPQVTPAAIEPALLLSAGWVALSGLIYVLFAFETRNRSLEEIDAAPRPTSAAAATGSGAGTRMA